MAITYGRKIEFGVKDPLPLHGFPPGRARIRQRSDAFTVVFIRPPEGGIRQFAVEPRNGAWWPAFETGANRNVSNDKSSASERSEIIWSALLGVP